MVFRGKGNGLADDTTYFMQALRGQNGDLELVFRPGVYPIDTKFVFESDAWQNFKGTLTLSGSGNIVVPKW